MRRFILLFLAYLCVSCVHINGEIPLASKEQARVVVFDIDGTLTPTVIKVWKARKGAARAAHFYAKSGYKILYLSARVPFLQFGILDWLEENGFPKGDIHVIRTSEYLDSHGKFKTRILKEYKAKGWQVAFAYGDSSTDFEAYASVGVPRDHVYALRREGDLECQPGPWNSCLNEWNKHVDSIVQMFVACQELNDPEQQAC